MSDAYSAYYRSGPPPDPVPAPEFTERWWPGPEEHPDLRAALERVNLDLAETLPDQAPLVLDAIGWSDGGVQIRVATPGEQSWAVTVRQAGGAWDGGGSDGEDDGDGAEDTGDPSALLGWVADAAQEAVMECRSEVWPVCPVHGLGLHAAPGPCGEELPAQAAGSWYCRGGGGHPVAPVGGLGGTRRRRSGRAATRRRPGGR